MQNGVKYKASQGSIIQYFQSRKKEKTKCPAIGNELHKLRKIQIIIIEHKIEINENGADL